MKQKKLKITVLLFTLLIAISSCKSSKIIDKEKINLMKDDEFVYINGLKIPVLSEDKKVFKETPAFKKAKKKILEPNEELYREFREEYEKLKAENKNLKYDEFRKIKRRKHFISTDNIIDENNLRFIDEREDGSTREYSYRDGRIRFYKETFPQETDIIDLYGNRITLYFRTCLEYYPNGNIKSYAVQLNSNHMMSGTRYIRNLNVGTWYLFDEQGNITKRIDIENLFETKLSEIFDYVFNSGDLLLVRKDGTVSTRLFCVSRKFSSKGNEWSIKIHTGTNYVWYIYIDDKTGKETERIDPKESGRYGKYESKFDYDALFEGFYGSW